MQKIMCAYGTEGYYENLKVLEQSAYEVGGVDKFMRYTHEGLKDSEYFIKNAGIMSRPFDRNVIDTYGKIRNAQYWIWKPYIILETMKLCEDGDIVFYVDGGMKVVDNLEALYEIARTNKNNRVFFSASQRYDKHLQSEYTKRDCFILMGLDDPKYWNARMGNSALSMWMKTDKNIQMITEWQDYMTDPRVVTDDANTCGQPNLPGYIEHRFDQSVMTLLALKYGDDLYRDPSQYSITEGFPNSPYGQLFQQHNVHLFA
jgi:hypothetical protein